MTLDYYTFGLKQKGYNNVVGGGNDLAQQWKLNGKEFNEDLGVNFYEMDLRQYDVAIARWIAIDPITHHSQSTYAAFDNNPVFWADPSGAATGFAGAVEQHAGGAGASKMGMDNEKWEYEEGDTYRNNSTGETTTNSKKATGETLGAFQDESYSVHAFDKEGEAYKFQKEKSESGKEVASLVTENTVFVLPWAENEYDVSHSFTSKNSLFRVGHGLFVKFLEELEELGKLEVLAQVHTHPTHSDVTGDEDIATSKFLKVPVYVIGPSYVGYLYNYKGLTKRTKETGRLKGGRNDWALPGEIYTGKESIRAHAKAIRLKKLGR